MTDTIATTAAAPEKQPATQQEYEAKLLEQVVVMGDLAKLTPDQRILYYQRVCSSLGLNPLTRPFDYLVLNGAMRLYANKTATDQLRALRGVSIDDVTHGEVEGLYVATVHGHDRSGRKDTEVGAVDIANLKGERRANAILKAITKAKRRLTLSLAGLGWLDDSEVGSIADAQPVDVDPETGEVLEEPTITESIAAKRAAITSGPTTRATEGGPEREEEAVGGSGRPAADEPPPPAAPDEVVPPDAESSVARASSAESTGDTSAAERCDGFHEELGRCVKKRGHQGHHGNGERETWT